MAMGPLDFRRWELLVLWLTGVTWTWDSIELLLLSTDSLHTVTESW